MSMHGGNCTWQGGTRFTRGNGRCIECDILKTKRITENLFNTRGENYGISKEDLKMFCLSGIKSARCTKWTNPKCACGKIVLNATA